MIQALTLFAFCSIASTAHSTELFFARLIANHTIELQPSKATFTIPQNWLELYHKDQFSNLHLSREQLEEARDAGNSEWDSAYAQIVDAVIPFVDCAFHGGGDGWGKRSGLYTDLQMRVYVVDRSLDVISKTIEEKGFSTAQGVARDSQRRRDAAKVQDAATGESLAQDGVDTWKRFRIAFPLFYDDYGGTANVEFYLRAFDDKTVVFVFMYSTGAYEAKEIPSIIASFRQSAAIR